MLCSFYLLVKMVYTLKCFVILNFGNSFPVNLFNLLIFNLRFVL